MWLHELYEPKVTYYSSNAIQVCYVNCYPTNDFWEMYYNIQHSNIATYMTPILAINNAQIPVLC